jgi:2,5-diketo-D-gluconate reductase B
MDTIITGGVSIPRLGFGTFRMPGGGCQPVIESALALGYRQSRRPSRPTGTR